MRQLIAVTKNACLQSMRQPIYGLIVVVTLSGMALLPALTGWTLDDDNKMLRDMGLSTLLVQGLFLAAFAASSVIDVEIEEKTVLSVAAKPVKRSTFLIGKYLGVLISVVAAHYMATIAFLMTMRHGVMQGATDTLDTPVLAFGIGLMLLAVIAATAMNYLLERRFLPTLVMLSLPTLTLGAALLLVVAKDWRFAGYVTRQELTDFPPDVAAGVDLKNLISIQPQPGNDLIAGHKVWLVRSNFKGPLHDSEQQYLLGLSTSQKWKKEVNFLVQECRKVEGPELVKASVLILEALAVVVALAVAASTRLGMMATFLVCTVGLALGLSADQVIRPWAEGSGWASALYSVVPNFQFFWMIDALSDERVIPWVYMGHVAMYGALYAAGLLALGTACFETREVG